jgi:hypothetical protein
MSLISMHRVIVIAVRGQGKEIFAVDLYVKIQNEFNLSYNCLFLFFKDQLTKKTPKVLNIYHNGNLLILNQRSVA